jgi:hypothetical protein
VAVVEEPVLVFATPMPSSEPSSIPSATPSAMPSSSPTVSPTAESVPNRAIIGGVGGRNFWILLIAILILLFMLLLCFFCWGRNKNHFWLPWYEVNTNPSWVLRELVDEAFCTFDDDDFSDMLLELDKPFEDTLDDEFISEKRNLARNYPVLKLRKSSWQEQNMNAGSFGLDIVDFSRKYSGEREMDDLFDELVVPFQTDEACLRDIILVPTALNAQEQQDWMDINDACHDLLFRDMLDEFEHRDTTFEDFIVEIGLGVDHPEGWADINDSFHDLLIRDDVNKTVRGVSVVTMTEELKELFPVEDDVTEEEMLILLKRIQGKIHVDILQINWLVFLLYFTYILSCVAIRCVSYYTVHMEAKSSKKYCFGKATSQEGGTDCSNCMAGQIGQTSVCDFQTTYCYCPIDVERVHSKAMVLKSRNGELYSSSLGTRLLGPRCVSKTVTWAPPAHTCYPIAGCF